MEIVHVINAAEVINVGKYLYKIRYELENEIGNKYIYIIGNG